MKLRDKYKTGFVTSYNQYAYLQISQDFIDALYIYSQFNDIVFDHLFKTANIPT